MVKTLQNQSSPNMFVFKNGLSEETVITLDIQNYKEAKDTNNPIEPYVGACLTIRTPGLNYIKDVSIDVFELEELASVFKKFINGEIKENYVWDHTERDMEFHFNFEEVSVCIHVPFDPSVHHSSGFFFELYGIEECKDFYDYLINGVGITTTDQQ